MAQVVGLLGALALVPGMMFAGDGLSSPVELEVSGGFFDAPHYASKAPGANAALNFGTRIFRVSTSASGSLVHKIGASGGYAANGRLGGELRFRGFSLHSGIVRIYVDQTEWTKRVHYVYGGAGYRWAGSGPDDRPTFVNVARLMYYRETFSTYYESHVREYRVEYDCYVRIRNSPWFVQLHGQIGSMSYVLNTYPEPEHRTSLTSQFAAGLAFRP